MKTFIYTLLDPSTNEIRYVGKTDYIKQRLYAHIIECKSDRKSHKINWIKSLLDRGLRPTISVLDEVPIDEWEYWEKYWIDQLKQWGCNLTNLSPGGKGGIYKVRESTKIKMRLSKVGIKLSDDHRNNISNSIKLKSSEFPNYNRSGGNLKVPIDKDELYQKYITENLSIPKCAKFFNVSEKKVFTNLEDYGIKKDKSVWVKQVAVTEKLEINQYSLTGELIKEWIGACDIEREIGIKSNRILECCHGRTNKTNGFIWRLKGDNNILRNINISKTRIPILQLDIDGNILNEYKSNLLSR